MFSQVHTQRQFAAMRGPRCQVCGTKMARTNVPWVIPQAECGYVGDQQIVNSPPTCEACQPIALRACPHLRQAPPVVVTAKSYRVVGVEGEYFPGPTQPPQRGIYLIGDRRAPWIMARQLAVSLEL